MINILCLFSRTDKRKREFFPCWSATGSSFPADVQKKSFLPAGV